MLMVTRAWVIGSVLLSSAFVISCGGGGGAGGSTSAQPTGNQPPPALSNVVAVVVDLGPDSATSPTVNTLYTTVTICVPGGTQCQTIDHIQVDTQSYGLRIISSVLSLTLPTAKASDGNALAECTQFVTSYSWGPVAAADIEVAGEKASSVPMQIIGAPGIAPVPANCSSTGMAQDTVASFGANGILGIGAFEQDCGPGCVGSGAPGFYYSCTQSACAPIAAPLASQVLNPVPLFTNDNNGSMIVLPGVAAAGAATVSGSLIFGIDTQSNNASGSETVFTLNGMGDFTAVLNNQTLNQSFIDSGTNGIFFNDGSITACASPNYSGFYCPAGTAPALTATLTGAGANPATAMVTFTVGNAQTLSVNNPTFAALPELAGTYAGTTATLDLGLPFFYGRRVATAIEGRTTLVGTGPYTAF